MKGKRSHQWILWLPVMLALPFFLLLFRAASLMHHPVWLTALSLSVLIGCGILLAVLQEGLFRQEQLGTEVDGAQKRKEQILQAFNEAGTLYREKVEALENAIGAFEEENQALQKRLFIAEQKTQGERNQVGAFQASLEDALDQLRASHAQLYFQQEVGKTLPKDLPAQYRQLREQFEEKSLILEQTRRRLFQIEGQLIASKKEESLLRPEEEKLIELLQQSVEENRYLEEEIAALEKLVASKPKKEKKEEQKPEVALELQF